MKKYYLTIFVFVFVFFILGITTGGKFLTKNRISWLFTKYPPQFSEQKFGALVSGITKQQVREIIGNPYEEGVQYRDQIGGPLSVYCDTYSKPRWMSTNSLFKLMVQVRIIQVCFNSEHRLVQLHDNIF